MCTATQTLSLSISLHYRIFFFFYWQCERHFQSDLCLINGWPSKSHNAIWRSRILQDAQSKEQGCSAFYLWTIWQGNAESMKLSNILSTSSVQTSRSDVVMWRPLVEGALLCAWQGNLTLNIPKKTVSTRKHQADRLAFTVYHVISWHKTAYFKHLNHSCHCWNYGFTRLLTTSLCWFVCMYVWLLNIKNKYIMKMPKKTPYFHDTYLLAEISPQLSELSHTH